MMYYKGKALKLHDENKDWEKDKCQLLSRITSLSLNLACEANTVVKKTTSEPSTIVEESMNNPSTEELTKSI